jgi:hypothetical protein
MPKPKKPVNPQDKRFPSGAPLLTTRMDPEMLNWITSRPEGTRTYLERLVSEDKAKGRKPESTVPQVVETLTVEVPEWESFQPGRSIAVALGELPPTQNTGG